MTDDADVMIAGGAEASISEIGIAGFNACKALSTKYESEPSAASRPYDINRDGFVMGEGSGIVVLEEFEALFIMRERTPITKALIISLPKLKYIMT